MAEFKSNLAVKKMRHRGIYSGKDYMATGIIYLPEGTVLAAGDDLLFVPVGENQIPFKVAVTGLNTGLAAGSLGYYQILDASGNPAVVERIGPNGDGATKFTSPATDTDAIAAAAAFLGYVEVEPTTIAKLAGPVMIGAEITTGATIGAGGAEIHVTAYFRGETSDKDVLAQYPDPLQVLDPDGEL